MHDPQTADSWVHALVANWRTAPLGDADRALLGFAAKLTHHPTESSPADLERLREQGFSDRAIHDATQVVAYFNYITRVAEGLGVEAELFIEPWGRESDLG